MPAVLHVDLRAEMHRGVWLVGLSGESTGGCADEAVRAPSKPGVKAVSEARRWSTRDPLGEF